MTERTSIEITKEQHEKFKDLQSELEDMGYPRPGMKDVVFHLIRFYEQNKGKEKTGMPEQANSGD